MNFPSLISRLRLSKAIGISVSSIDRAYKAHIFPFYQCRRKIGRRVLYTGDILSLLTKSGEEPGEVQS